MTIRVLAFNFVLLFYADATTLASPTLASPTLASPWCRQAQDIQIDEQELPGVELKVEAQDEESVDSSPESDSEEPSQESTEPLLTTGGKLPAIDEQYIRFHLWDGLIVGGNATIESVDVETEFGSLRIPIGKILRFHPGLDSMTGMQAKFDQLVEDLGDRNFEVRERAHQELLKWGGLLRKEIFRFEDGGSAERKKHLVDLRKKIEELEQDEDGDASFRPLIRGDYIETASFSVVGKIVQSEFRLKSQIGEMIIPLEQIKMADRTFAMVAPESRKTVEVGATTFFPDGLNTRIKVNRGDKVSIGATGEVRWTNWNSSCGPDGQSDKGQFKSINSGTLMAQIGTKGQYLKIGSSSSFIAKSSGELYLGIAMAENFRSGGYTWDGKYIAKVVVKPGTAQ